jgi:hypothetical protein
VRKSLRPSNGAASPSPSPPASGAMPQASQWKRSLARLPRRCPPHTVDHGSDRAFRLDLGGFIVGAASPIADLQRRLPHRGNSPHLAIRGSPEALMAEAWQQSRK